MDWRPSAVKVYRALLFAYPAEFRHEYGSEMERLFEDRLQAEPRWRVWRQALADVVLTAPREHGNILSADLRHAARLFAAASAFTAVVLLALALGIGANVAIFSLLNAVLLRSLPYGEAERLVYIWTPNAHLPPPVPRELGPAPADFNQWQLLTHSFSSLTACSRAVFNVPGGNGALDRVPGARVTSNFFQTLEVHTQIGRTIQSDDGQVAVISEAFWHSRFGAAADILARSILLDGRTYRVIGVMPPDFHYPRGNELPEGDRDLNSAQIWIPLIFTAKQKTMAGWAWDIDLVAIGRLRSSVSVRQAQSEMSAVMQRLDPLHPADEQGIGHGWSAWVVPMLDTALGPVRPQMWLMFGAVSLVLLIACGNVANLLLARAAGRGHEMGVRSIMGACRARLIRQLLTESVLLGCGGGLLGILVARPSIALLLRLNPGNIPRLEQTALNGRVLLFAVGASVLTGLLFGIAPALAISRTDLTTALKQGGNRGTVGTSQYWRRSLMIAEVSLSVILLVGAGLLIHSYQRLEAEGPGFTPNALSLRIYFNDSYRNHLDRQRTFVRSVLDEVRHLPGNPIPALISEVPLTHAESAAFLRVEGDPERKPQMIDSRRGTSGYFAAMNIPLIEGRLFDDDDVKRTGVVVNQAFAKRFYPGRSALGRHVQWGSFGGPNSGPISTIVGVVGDVHHSQLDESPRPEAYFPLAGVGLDSSIFLVVRSSGHPAQLASSIRAIIQRIDPTLTIDDVHTTEGLIAQAGALRRFQTVLLTAFAALALFLALLGVYAVIAYSVRQRTAEIGLRMALGASRKDVLRLVLGEGIALSLAGLILGLAAAAALTRLLASWLYAVSPGDPATFAGVAVLVLSVTVMACLLPAARAMRIDPGSALRYE